MMAVAPARARPQPYITSTNGYRDNLQKQDRITHSYSPARSSNDLKNASGNKTPETELDPNTIDTIGPVNEQKVDQEIQMLRPNGWKLVKSNLKRITEYGHREGILTGDSGPLAGQLTSTAILNQNDETENLEKGDKHDDDIVKITTHDLSLIHAAIPFLPVPVAGFCFVLNVICPGTGTILSGVCSICMGQPRINFKEGRRFMTLLVNLMVGIAQMGTVTFLLVGWFWSMAWGGLLLTHSLQYREALMQHRQEAVATAAIEALTRDAILRRRDVRTLVQERKQGQSTAPEYRRRRSTMFGRLGAGKKSQPNDDGTSAERPPNGNSAA